MLMLMILTANIIGDIGKWFELVFSNQTPSDIYIRPDQKLFEGGNFLCIMDDPNYKMSLPLIDFDMNRNIKTIIDSSKEAPGGRKSMCGTVRGMGGGKTRAFEEMRRHLLQKEGTFLEFLFFFIQNVCYF